MAEGWGAVGSKAGARGASCFSVEGSGAEAEVWAAAATLGVVGRAPATCVGVDALAPDGLG
jgi:hypothetical protein